MHIVIYTFICTYRFAGILGAVELFLFMSQSSCNLWRFSRNDIWMPFSSLLPRRLIRSYANFGSICRYTKIKNNWNVFYITRQIRLNFISKSLPCISNIYDHISMKLWYTYYVFFLYYFIINCYICYLLTN